MKKRSHLFVTREIIEQVPQNKRKWLLLCSILPDILVHTYIKKHTWKSSFDNTVHGFSSDTRPLPPRNEPFPRSGSFLPVLHVHVQIKTSEIHFHMQHVQKIRLQKWSYAHM